MLARPIALLATLSLAAGPVLAQSAPPLSPAPVTARAGAQTAGNSDLEGGGWFPPALFALIVIGGVLLATGVLFDDDDETPVSP
jgi:hypothetical protein